MSIYIASSAVVLCVFLSFFMGFAAGLLAEAVPLVKSAQDPEEIAASQRVADAALLVSPMAV
jgi:hypothetical protein